MAKNTIKTNNFMPHRHSCILLAGIYLFKNGFPIKDSGNDGFLGMWSGKLL